MSLISVQVAYALPERQTVIALRVAEGTTALEAVQASGILAQYPDLDGERLELGVFGTAVAHTRQLAAGDRVEIYRALARHPTAARRRRARLQGD